MSTDFALSALNVQIRTNRGIVTVRGALFHQIGVRAYRKASGSPAHSHGWFDTAALAGSFYDTALNPLQDF